MNGAGVYFREHVVELGLSTIGVGSRTPEGQIDPVGGVIGSLDEILIYDAGNGMVYIEVHNRMGWASATRIPGTEVSLREDRPRGQKGPGGTIKQIFYWWEPRPDILGP